MTQPQNWAPDACTLPTTERPLRGAEFDALFASALRAVHRPAPTRLRLTLDPAAEATARDLFARETECCSFFTFGFIRDDGQLRVDADVPDAYVEVLDGLAGQARAAL